jgi:hypothetical protein
LDQVDLQLDQLPEVSPAEAIIGLLTPVAAFYNRVFEEVYCPLFPAMQFYLDRLAPMSIANLPA